VSSRLEMLEKLIARGATDPFVHYAHAMELRGLGRAEEALRAFQSVRERFPDYVPTYLMAGQLAAQQAAYARAREFLTAGLAAAKAAGDDHATSELSSALATLPESDPPAAS
jgi:tetratricopeptide (TPR) repeat protein